MRPTSPSGIPIAVQPIELADLDRIVLRCWPEEPALKRLFAQQGTIGMAAWERDRCVAQLHCYRVVLPDEMNQDWPEWSQPWWWAIRSSAAPSLAGPVWCHACMHVGRTLESKAREGAEFPSKGILAGSEPAYHGRGIGTALAQLSVQWARERDYAAVLAMGAPGGLFAFARWSGQLPWTSYAKLGFEALAMEPAEEGLPAWARGDSPPEVMSEVQSAIANGRPAADMRGRLMMLDLRNIQPDAAAEPPKADR